MLLLCHDANYLSGRFSLLYRAAPASASRQKPHPRVAECYIDVGTGSVACTYLDLTSGILVVAHTLNEMLVDN
jgi:hypothetical protein